MQFGQPRKIDPDKEILMTPWRTPRLQWGAATLALAALLTSSIAFAVAPEAAPHRIPLKIMQDSTSLAGIQPEYVPKGGWPPLWIDARAIELTPEGKLDLEQPTPFAPNMKWRELFEQYRPGQYGPQGSIRATREAQDARGCHPVGEMFGEEVLPPDRSSLAHTAESAETVVLGTVLGKSYGFYRGIPGQLIKLAPIKTVGLGPRSTRSAFFFFMPVGELQIGNERICKSDMRYATPPGVGEEVFVFTRPPVGENHDVLDVHDAREVVPIRQDGTAAVPGENDARTEARAPLLASGRQTKAQILTILEKRTDR